MTTRRTPTQMAQDALDTADRKVDRAKARLFRARAEVNDSQVMLDRALIERAYAEDHPLLRASVSVDAEYGPGPEGVTA